MTPLGAIYASLPQPPSAGGSGERVFSVSPIDGYPGYFVARTDADQPALIIDIAGRPRAPIILQNLAVKFNAPCQLNLSFQHRNTTAAVVECLACDNDLRRYFLTIAGHLLEELGPTPSPTAVVKAIDSLISLFQRLTRPPRRETQGLFGELVVIESARDPVVMLGAWHVDPFDCFDFIFESGRLEVKTSARRRRTHDFSFEQCNPPPGTPALLASLFVENAGGGLSLEGLIFRIEARLSRYPSAIMKLHAVVSDALGLALPSALKQRFDEQLAFSSIAFYDLTAIPAVRGELAPEISGVRFRSDLSGLAPLSRTDVSSVMPMLGS